MVVEGEESGGGFASGFGGGCGVGGDVHQVVDDVGEGDVEGRRGAAEGDAAEWSDVVLVVLRFDEVGELFGGEVVFFGDGVESRVEGVDVGEDGGDFFGRHRGIEEPRHRGEGKRHRGIRASRHQVFGDGRGGGHGGAGCAGGMGLARGLARMTTKLRTDVS